MIPVPGHTSDSIARDAVEALQGGPKFGCQYKGTSNSAPNMGEFRQRDYCAARMTHGRFVGVIQAVYAGRKAVGCWLCSGSDLRRGTSAQHRVGAAKGASGLPPSTGGSTMDDAEACAKCSSANRIGQIRCPGA
jgi:hypothetical protein